MRIPTRVTRLAALAATLAISAFAMSGAPTAEASSALDCAGTAEHPFRAWLDPAAYVLAPGGSFEGRATSWELAGGARLNAGNEPFKVHGSADSSSLAIPASGSALSPSFCVGIGHPTLRFFATGGNTTSPLKVEITYATLSGTITQQIALIPAMRSWQATPQQLILANLTGLSSLKGLTSIVKLRFSAPRGADWTIDDVYIDPWKVT